MPPETDAERLARIRSLYATPTVPTIAPPVAVTGELSDKEKAKLLRQQLLGITEVQPTPLEEKEVVKESAQKVAVGGKAVQTSGELARLRSAEVSKALSEGATPEEARSRAAAVAPPPGVIGEYEITQPYQVVTPAKPTEPVSITGALRPQVRQLGIVESLAPGAAITEEGKLAAQQEVERRREELRSQLREGGRGAVPLPAGAKFGIPRELAAQKLSEPEIEQIVQREYPKGQEVGQVAENPVFWAARLLTAPQSALAGAVGAAIGKVLPETKARIEAARPPQLRESGYIASNIAEGGGFMKELGDIAKYTPGYEWLETPAKVAGFALDVIIPDPAFAVAGDVAKGVRAGKEAVAAARATGAAPKVAEVAERAARSSVSSAVERLPFVGKKAAEKIEPGDIRTTFGAKVAEDIAASKTYKRTFDEQLALEREATPGISDADASIAAHGRALETARNEHGLASRFVQAAQKEGPATRVALEGDYFKVGDDVLQTRKGVEAATDSLKAGRPLSKVEQIAIRQYLAPAISGSGRLARLLTESFKKEGIAMSQKLGTDDFFDVIYKPENEGLRKYLSNSIDSIVNFETGALSIDNAVNALTGGTGAKLYQVTRNTISDARGRDTIINAYQNSNFYKNVVKGTEPKKEGALGYIIRSNKPIFKQSIEDAIARARTTAQIDNAALDRMSDSIKQGFIKADDLRELSYSEVDAIASQIQKGLTPSAITPSRITKVPEAIAPGTAVPIGQAARLEELTTDVPLYLKKASNELGLRGNQLKQVITKEQRDVLQNSKNAISNLNKRFQGEVQDVIRSPEVRQTYDIPDNPTSGMVTFGLGRGKKTGVPTLDIENARVHAENVINSMLFRKGKFFLSNPLDDALNPGYNAIKLSTKAEPLYDELVEIIANTPVSKIDAMFPTIVKKAEELAKKNADVFMAEAGEKIYVLPKQSEVLSGAYASTKANEIFSGAVSQSIKSMPGILDDEILVISKAIGKGPKEASRFVYLLAEAEIQAQLSGKKGPIQLYKEAATFEEKTGILKSLFKKAYREVDTTSKLGELGLDIDTAAQWLSGRADRAGFIASMETMMEKIRRTGLYQDRALEETLQTIRFLKNKRIDASQAMSASLIKEYMSIIGGAPNLNRITNELGSIAEKIDKGNVSAVNGMRLIRKMVDLYNQGFYYLILDINPMYHATNFLSAPFIVAFNTGRLVGMNPKDWVDATSIAALGSKLAKGGSDVVVATDALGNQITRGMAYDDLIRSGIFRSQRSAEVSSQFIDDSATFLNESIKNGFKLTDAKKVLSIPTEFLGSPLAEYTDNVWRIMTYKKAIQAGKTRAEAIDEARRSLYDYGDITNLEKRVTQQWLARNALVFYNFWRQSNVTFIKKLFENPSAVMKSIIINRDLNKFRLGDQESSDLSFYYPGELAAKPIMDLAESSIKDTGVIAVGPDMAYKDGLTTIAMLLADPGSIIWGPEIYGKEKTAYEEGIIFERLGPISKAVVRKLVAGEPIFTSAKMKANTIPAEHMVVYKALGMEEFMTDAFNIRKKEAESQTSKYAIEGEEYIVSGDDFDKYKAFMMFIEATGAKRPLREWGNILSTVFPETLGAKAPSALEQRYGRAYELGTLVGLPKEMKIPSEEERIQKLLEAQQRMLQEQRTQLKKEK